MRRGPAYAGIFAAALATLMLEILLTRIVSVIGWYHLAFFVIALAMLGMTAGAAVVFLWPRWFEDVPRRLAESALGFAVLAPPAFAWTMAGPLMPVTDLMGFWALLGLGVVLALPFAVVGVTLTLALTRAGLPPGRAYGVDLIGAALGCLLVIPLLDAVDAASAVLVAGAVAGAAALAFAAARTDVSEGTGRKGQVAALVVTLGWTAAAWGNAAAEVPSLRPAWVKGEHEDPLEFAYVGWNTHSRVTVSQPQKHPPRLWAAGRNLPVETMLTPVEERTLKIDGAAETGMARFAGSDHAYLEWDVATFAHRMRPRGPAAVIGVGGGRDVLEAVRVGHSPVVGVEINEKIVGLHRGAMAEYSGIAGLPGVELVADEARSFFTRDERRYEVITMSLIDTWASTGAGAYSLSENGLYTVEGWQVFLRRLTPTGVFTVSRWYVPGSPGETGRMLALAMTTLWRMGATDPRAHLILLQQASVATLLVSPSPFAAADLDRMQAEAVRLGFNMVMTPRKLPAPPLLRAIAEAQDEAAIERFAATQTLDLTPPHDDRPFFFNMLRPRAWLAKRTEVDELDLSFLGNLQATQTLVYATLVSVVLTIVAVFGPLWLRRRQLGAGGGSRAVVAAACGYFALIGLGFMFVEIGLISRVGVFLGHPTLALAVVLGGIVLATGVGSLVSGWVPVQRARVAWFFPLLPGLLVVATRAAASPVMDAFAGAPVPTRVLLTLALIAPPALAMGLCFPLGLRLVREARGEAATDITPWLWGVNGACGVCASGLALGTSMAWGIQATLAIGAVCYFALPLCTWWLTRR
jgi:predicted membrane-bound spermidine synthase